MKTPKSALAVRILGTGEYLPRRVVDSAFFDRQCGKPAGWTATSLGVARRHVASPDETSSVMGAHAAREAMAAAGMQAGELDCIVSAASVMEQAIPCLASQIQQRLDLGRSGIPAFDVNATCLSFLTAMDLMACAIVQGRYRRVLIVSSEIASAGLNMNDPTTAGLFGDGAAAIVLGRSPEGSASSLLASHLETYGIGNELCQVRAGGTRVRIGDGTDDYQRASYFEMKGKDLYRMSAHYLPGVLASLWGMAAIEMSDLDWIIPHQASGKALDHLTDLLMFPVDKLVRVIEERGNQVATSVPAALHYAILHKNVQRGELLALIGSGAGLSLGGIVLRY
jgi:3-oxoacyl-[acyl-carrier-protein] synthase III